MKGWILAAALAVVVPVAALAQRPPDNVSKKRHPNLAAAQHLVEQAYNKVTAAQSANEWDLDGHAEKAKKLLEDANEQLKQAAMAANTDRKQDRKKGRE